MPEQWLAMWAEFGTVDVPGHQTVWPDVTLFALIVYTTCRLATCLMPDV